MKKYLPVVLLLVGVFVLVVAFFVVRGIGKKEVDEDDESALIELPLEKRPVVSLTPTEDGYYLVLKVEKIVVEGASTMDYELIYDVPDHPSQGVPGTVDIEGKESFEAELLLGSESSGKFRYDEGVEEGTLTLRFRNEDGKLMVKLTSDFHLQSGTSTLTSLDGKFTYELDNMPEEGFFVTMETFGVPKDPGGSLLRGPYGIFGSIGDGLSGDAKMDHKSVFRFDGEEWEDVHNNKSPDIGIFIAVGE
jgi:hypothetical protein